MPFIKDLSKKLDEIKTSTGNVLQDIINRINKEKTEDLSLAPIQQALQEMKEDINSLSQYLRKKDEEDAKEDNSNDGHENTAVEAGANEEDRPKIDSSKDNGGSKKKAIYYLNYINRNSNLALWIIIVLLVLVILFNKIIVVL